jgi:hypothetical protein
MQGLKILWGVVLAIVFLHLLVRFKKSAATAQGIKYNWLAVGLSFFTIGLALWLIFFVQV